MSLVHSVHDRTFIDARHSASRTIANLNSLFAAAAPRRRRDRAQRSLSHRRDDDAHAAARSIDVEERRFTLSAIPPYSSSSVSTHSTSIWQAHYSFDSYAHTNTFTLTTQSHIAYGTRVVLGRSCIRVRDRTHATSQFASATPEYNRYCVLPITTITRFGVLDMPT
jgi:hypothetical protein